MNGFRAKWAGYAAATLIAVAAPAIAQQKGGTLRLYHRDSPASMSILEEATISTVVPMMAVMSNLVMFDQHKPQNSLDTIVPDLATSWAWSEDGKTLTFKLKEGVKWHDGKPFTAKDVKCIIAQGLPDRSQSDRLLGGRPGPAILRKLLLRLAA